MLWLLAASVAARTISRRSRLGRKGAELVGESGVVVGCGHVGHSGKSRGTAGGDEAADDEPAADAVTSTAAGGRGLQGHGDLQKSMPLAREITKVNKR